MSASPRRVPGADSPYDPELHCLRALEREIRRSAERALRVSPVHVPDAERRSPRRSYGAATEERRRRPFGEERHSWRGSASTGPFPFAGRSQRGSRVARRSLTLVALLCLIGATAYGAQQVLSGSSTSPVAIDQGPFALVAQGRAGSDDWSLRLYRRGGELCRVLAVAGDAESSRCIAPPAAGALDPSSLVSPLRRYVFGVAGRAIAWVTVSVGGRTSTISTYAPDATRARRAGLPAGARYFVAVLPRPAGGSDGPALVRGLDSRLRPLGRGHSSRPENV
jgi:hypothetical protein